MIGPQNVGKTSYLEKLSTGECDSLLDDDCDSDFGASTFAFDFKFKKTDGTLVEINFFVFDIHGGEYQEMNYINSEICLAMCDKNIHKLDTMITTFKRFSPSAQLIIVKNKQDKFQDDKDYEQYIQSNNLTGFKISVKTNLNIYEPFLHIAKTYIKDNVQLVSEQLPVISPPTSLSPFEIKEYTNRTWNPSSTITLNSTIQELYEHIQHSGITNIRIYTPNSNNVTRYISFIPK
jgi:GTPase SAR1 family protein